jgi:hypothetical protein
MKATWIKKNGKKPEVILRKIQSMRKIDTNGDISFVGFGIEEPLHVLFSLLKFSEEIDDDLKSRFIWKSIVKTKGNLDEVAIIRNLNKILSTEYSSRIEKL